jgi:hypothetical protein
VKEITGSSEVIEKMERETRVELAKFTLANIPPQGVDHVVFGGFALSPAIAISGR